MGIVYKARDLKLDRFAALKFLPPHMLLKEDAKRRFTHEAKAASAIDSPYIGTVYEIDETPDGQIFIAMAYYEGKTLKEMLESGALRVEEAIDIAMQVAQGLAEAHARDIIHRDIKPSNILVTKDGVAKIIDFGLAKLSGATKVTKTGETTGTAAYMSPEQAKGEEVDHRTDIFSLGIVLYEMLTGVYPFKGEYEAAVLHSIITDEPEPLDVRNPDLPEPLQGIIDKTLEKDPDSRCQSAAELLNALRDIKQIISGRDGRSTHNAKLGRKKGIIITLTVIIAVYAAYAVFLAQTGRPARTPPFGNMIARLIKGEKAPRRSQEVCAIAVTPFWGNNESASHEGLVMQELLIRKLGEILGEDENTIILATEKTKIPRSHAEARSLGRQLNASMVIWGEVVILREETETQPHISIVYPLKTLKDKSPAALQTESADPNQIRSRKMKAEEISTMAIYAAAKYYAQKDNYEKALAVVHSLPNTDSKRFILQGYILSNLARDDEAIEAYRKAALLDPKDPLPHLRMGWNFEMKESYDEAFAEYEKAIATKPDSAWSYVAMAHFYAGRGKTDLALATLERAIALEPQDEETNAYIAEVFHCLGLYQNAINQFKKTIAIAPHDPQLRCRLGIVYKDLGQYEKAIAEYRSAISLAPKDPAPFSWIGTAYVEQERYKEAIEPFRKSLELDPTDFSVYLGLGISYGKLGNRDQAIRYFNKALEYGKGEFPEMIHTSLAINYRTLGWNDSAIAEYKRAIECTADTQFTDVGHYELATLYDEIGDFEHALNEYRKASEIESNPDYSLYHLQYFVSLCRLGRQKEAQTYIHEYSRKLKKAKWHRDDVFSAVVDFYSGEISEEEVLKFAQKEDSKSNLKCSGCLVNYYLAMPRLLTMELASNSCSVDTVKALAYLEKSQVGCDACRTADYYKLAKIELQRLRNHLSKNQSD